MSDWAAQRGLTLAGDMWEVHLTDPSASRIRHSGRPASFLEVQ
jgi:hypothetical protein